MQIRPRRYQVDPWSTGREVARGVQRSSPKPEKSSSFCHRRGTDNFCLLHGSAQMFFYQTPGRHPPPVTGRFVNTVTRGWVGTPNERALFRFHGAVVCFVDACLSRTRNLAASNKHLAEFFSGRSWPKIGPGMFFFGVFEKFETVFPKICAHSGRYGDHIFEIQTFFENIAFPLALVSHHHDRISAP